MALLRANGRDPRQDLIDFADYFNTPLAPQYQKQVTPVDRSPAQKQDESSQPPAQAQQSALKGDSEKSQGGSEKRERGASMNADDFTSSDLSALDSEETLKMLLLNDNIDPTVFGQGKAKTLKALLKEIQEGSSFLERNSGTGKIQRVVEPVFIQLRYKNLVLVEAVQTLEDGRERPRNMLLAEKKDKEDGGVGMTAVRGVYEELGIPLKDLELEKVIKFRDDLYCFEVEKLDSASYPGLPCIYRTHYTQLDILDEGLPIFKKFNLPQGEDFVTYEESALGTKKHQWKWMDVEEAQKKKVKKFPPDMEAESRQTSDTMMPENEEALRTFLEASKVDCNQWGTGKAKTVLSLFKEIQEGSSTLEMNQSTGNVQRVVEPVFIKLKYKNMVLVETEQEMADGRKRTRNMVIAEKKEPRDLNVYATSIRGLYEELGIPIETLKTKGALRFREDVYCCRTEYMDSSSYPGLACVYRTHYSQLDILDEGVFMFETMGLPNGDAFETLEKGKKHWWDWYDVEAAAERKIKGYLEAQGKTGIVVKVPLPESADELTNILKDDGIDLRSWGVGKAKTVRGLFLEVTSGNCKLERSPKTARLVRVVEPAYIAFKWRGEELVQVDEDLEQDETFKQRKRSMGRLFAADDDIVFGAGLRRNSVDAPSNAPGKVTFREDLSCFEVENYESVCYPGLQVVYRTKYVQLKQSSTETEQDRE